MPVKPLGHKWPPFQPRFCDTKTLTANDNSQPELANDHLAQLSSPLSSTELAFTGAVVPTAVKAEPTFKPIGACEDFVPCEPFDISLETASSTEHALSARVGKHTEVGIYCTSGVKFPLAVLQCPCKLYLVFID